ncbi:MAG: T9SS type A sorting domain-containing protein [Bacteroidia bacterium]|nr:T9SS type A sorting domain-containing protein [Bacteroidia bacterium]MDW8157276.1 T9SS type A sorting domain-containing protein [Bacteroidia bacterium]
MFTLIFFILSTPCLLWSQESFYVSPNSVNSVSKFQSFNLEPISQPFLPELQKWIKKQYPFLQFLPGDLTIDTLIQSPAGIHARFAQTYKGKKIYDASIKVNLNLEFQVQSTISNLKNYSITSTEHLAFGLPAQSTIQNILPPSKYQITNWDSCYFVQGIELIAAYRVTVLEISTLKAWEIIIDANGGKILRQEILSAYYCAPPETTVQAYIYKPDPLTKKRKYYQPNTNFSDNHDQDNVDLNAARELVRLEGCEYKYGTYFLIGPNVQIVNLLFPNIEPVTSSRNQFFFTRSHPGFEQVNAYYHIDQFHRYLEKLGYGSLVNYSIKVDAQGSQEDNSYFTPSGTDSFIIFGTGGVDDAEDADVIIHEYGHAITYSAAPNTNIGAERRGIDEGYGDYLAAIYSRKIDSFRWQEIYTWDGHNEFWPGRIVNSRQVYYPEIARQNIYIPGTIWASALAHAMEMIAEEEANKIVLQSMYMLESNITLPEAAQLVLQAENNITSGKNRWAYIHAFCVRNILPPDQCQSANIEETIESSSAPLIYPNPTDDFLILDLRNYAFEVELQILDVHGKTIYQQYHLPALQSLEIKNFPQGLYYLRLHKKNKTLYSTKLLVQRSY